jgi:spore maturation protein CgeB
MILMRIVMFCHSLLSDWNHGTAHFLRGIAMELLRCGHDIRVYEAENAWSLQNLLKEHGQASIQQFHARYPGLTSTRYDPQTLDLDKVLDGADLVLVHEWNDHALVRRIGQHRARVGSYRVLFHDTHQRSITNPKSMEAYDLTHYDGVEGLFTPGKDFLVARNGTPMQRYLKTLLQDEAMAHELAGHGLETVLTRHTCAHRVDELMSMYAELEGEQLEAAEGTCAAH